MPDPSNYASEDAFMEACVPMMMDEGRDQDQAVAACMQMWRDKAAPSVDRAWSVLTVKSVNTERREIEGIASTPSVDRVGDIVEPLGAKFSLPMPLLHHHDSRSPVGHVVAAKATKDGITIKAKLVQITEPGPVKDRVDTAWQEIKHGLVRGLSIGFKPLEYEALKEGGLRFLSYAWHELSLVTIPAQAEAQISLIKSLDTEQRTALDGFEIGAGTIPASPGASGTSSVTPTAVGTVPSAAGASAKSTPPVKSTVKTMPMTTAEAISASEASRQAKAARMAAMMEEVNAKGETFDEDDEDEYEGLKREVEKLDKHLERLHQLAKINAATAKPVEQVKTAEAASEARGGGSIRIKAPDLPPGLGLTRVIKCVGIARGNLVGAVQVAESLYPDDQRIQNVLKAAVSAGSVNNATWAGALVSSEGALFADFAEFLRPQTIVGKFGTNGIPALRNVPFRVPLGVQTAGGAAAWVGEGMAKPLTDFAFSRTTLEPFKVASIVAVTEELLRHASIPAETLLRDQLVETLRARLDFDFIDPSKTAVPGTSPASITAAVTTIAATGTGTADDVRADIYAVMAQFIAADNPPTSGVWIMSSTTALALSMMTTTLGVGEDFARGLTMNGGTFAGLPVIVSEYVNDTTVGSPNTPLVWLVNASDIYLGDSGGFAVDMSREASLVMDNAPTMASGGIGSPGEPTAAQVVSMWQTNSVAFRAEREISWAKRRSSAVQGLHGVAWGAS